MKVLMIHGIGQEDSTSDVLLKRWIKSLHDVSPGLLDPSNTRMAYYGTTLADWTTGKVKAAVGMGAEGAEIDIGDEDELKFLTEALQEVADDQDVTDAEIGQASAEADHQAGGGHVVPMDNFIARQLVGLVRALEKLSPAKGTILLRVIKQGHTYLSSPGAAKAVDDIVRPLLQASPQVLITHSLGTVVAFKLLREMHEQGKSVEIPLLITMGSPLGLDAFMKKLGPPRLKPPFVKEWRNFYDPSDFVALGKSLSKEFANGIIDDGTVDNFTPNAHGIIGYLPHKGVIDALKDAL